MPDWERPVARERPDAGRARRRQASQVEERRVAQREEPRVLGQRLLRHFAQRAVVVQDVEPPAERRKHEVVLAALYRHVAHLDDRHAALELHHFLPPSNDVKSPNSVPANSRSPFTWSWMIDHTSCLSGRFP